MKIFTLRSLLPTLLLFIPFTQGCPPGQSGRLLPDKPKSACVLEKDEVQKARAEVSATFDYAVTSLGGDASLDELKSVQTNFDDIQRDYGLATFNLCNDFEAGRIKQQDYTRRRACLDEALWAMRAMETELKATSSTSQNAKQAAWSAGGKISWMREALSCRDTRSNFAESNTKKGGEISMTAYLLCQRQTESGQFTDVPDCNAQPLREGDRVKIGASIGSNAHLYVVNYNNKGQFQVLFPAPGQDNAVRGGAPFFLPEGSGGDSWLVLDDVAGVTEYLQVVASEHQIPELETRRGMNLAPTTQGQFAPQAIATRGLLEPVLHRGFEMPKASQTKVNVGQDDVDTVPVQVKGLGATVVEFEVVHD